MSKRNVELKRHLLRRDGRQCVFCRKALGYITATFDHIVPQCRGGRLMQWNLAIACKQCNETRPSASYHDFLDFMRLNGRSEEDIAKYTRYIANYHHEEFLKYVITHIRNKIVSPEIRNAVLKYFGLKRSVYAFRLREVKRERKRLSAIMSP